ncbi:hypothetical protein EI555_011023, partial [Monodon monoceros]
KSRAPQGSPEEWARDRGQRSLQGGAAGSDEAILAAVSQTGPARRAYVAPGQRGALGGRGCRALSSGGCEYKTHFAASVADPERFWGKAAEQISWYKPWTKTLENRHSPSTSWRILCLKAEVKKPIPQVHGRNKMEKSKRRNSFLCFYATEMNMFVEGMLNICYNAIDRHIENGKGDKIAIIYDSPVTNTKATITYKEVLEQVSKLAGVLVKHDVKKGDTVVIYMPMIPQAMYTMLACARIGAIHSLIFGGFASRELSSRIDHAKPKVVVTASFGIEPGRKVEYIPLLEEALRIGQHKPDKVLIYNRPNMEPVPLAPGRDLDWDEEMAKAQSHDCVPVLSEHPLYILYTSGTTGLPKGVVRPTGGYAVMLNWSMSSIYGLKPGEVWWAASDLGWVVGHSYICYGPLLHGNTTVLYESVLSHGTVADCAVVGKEDPLKGHVPLALCVLKKDINTTEEQVLEEIVKHVRQSIGPVAAFRKAVFVKQLPKTRSGKIPRSALSALVNGKPYKLQIVTQIRQHISSYEGPKDQQILIINI